MHWQAHSPRRGRNRKQWSDYRPPYGSPWFDDSKTHGRRTGAALKALAELKRPFWGLRYFLGGPLHRQMTTRPVQAWGGVELTPELPSVHGVRADCGGRLFTAKLRVVVHYLPHQLLDHLLANGAVLTLPPPIPNSTVPRFYSSDDPPWCRVRATHRETVIPSDLLSPRSLGSRGKAAADNQFLRLHRPQAPVSPTAAS